MSKRSTPGRVPALAVAGAFAAAAAACSPVPNPAYTGPGWYLEKPTPLLAAGPQIFAGPFSYEQCEAERLKLPQSTSERMICFRQLVPPGPMGPYVIDGPPAATSASAAPAVAPAPTPTKTQ